MKIIISHDVDHLKPSYNTKLLIFKFIIRGLIEFLIGVISFKEYLKRLKTIYINKWHNLNELMEFNKRENIPSTFFLGMANGFGLNYPLKDALYWVKIISAENFDVGVHGISCDNYDLMIQEYQNIKNLINKDIGIRMHYLNMEKDTLNLMSKMGYKYDTTVLEDKNPYKLVNNMWEFPLHIMDGNIMYQHEKRWVSENLDFYKKITINRLKDLEYVGIQYVTILFHDQYFNDGFKIWKEWYIWLIGYLKENNYEFISYQDAMSELEIK